MKDLIHLHALHDDGSAKLRLVNEKLAVQKTLHQKKLTPKSALVEAEQEAIEAKLSLAEIEGKIIETEATVLESRRRLEDVIASRRQRQADQLSSIMLELSELDTQVLAFRNRIERGTFKAPIRGVIQELNAKFPGQIIAPGERLLELIPANDDLIVEARLSTKEVRHVRTGQKVRITVDGIDPHRVGYLEGNVQHLSPSTFIDESGTPYYRLWIALTTNYLAGAHLIPGMTIQAQINTGQRTVFEYLFKPVYRAWDTAFRER
jgi:HlyD family secretion protein/adhesin transport system membrane fusion protein